MKGRFLISSALLTALLSASCASDNVTEQDLATAENTLTFSLRTPAGEKVSYTRAALHDEPEYAVNSLQLYEYEIVDGDGGEKTTELRRIMSYPTGTGKNVISLSDNGDGRYSFSIVIPADYKGKSYTYRLVANNATTNVKPGESADKFRDEWYSAVTLAPTTVTPEPAEGDTETGEPATGEPVTVAPKGDALANPEKGIAMTGSAIARETGKDEIRIGETTQCDVRLTRIVSRVDIRYATPNLRLTKVELRGAPVKTFLWPRTDAETGSPLYADVDRLNVGLSSALSLPEYYLKDNTSETAEKMVELRKAFYLYERANSEEDSATVHIEYTVDANGTEYTGTLDVPFRRTSGDRAWIDTERNHLYTIVLGNGDDPVAGKVSATLIVDDWNLVEIDEPITD